jgi:hypothetical protein
MATVKAGTCQGDKSSCIIIPKGCRGKVPGVTAWEDNRHPALIGVGKYRKAARFSDDTLNSE